MKKGITPIIAIIVLLLITIALAGAAFSFLTTYYGGTTGKAIQIKDRTCVGGTTARIVVQNIGTQAISLDTDPDVTITCTVSSSTADCEDVTVTLQGGTSGLDNPECGNTICERGENVDDGTGIPVCADCTTVGQTTTNDPLAVADFDADSIAPQETAVFTDECTATEGLCQYRFRVEGTGLGAVTTEVNC